MFATQARHSKPLAASAPWLGPTKADARVGAFVDDIIRMVIPAGNDDRAIVGAANFDSRALTGALDMREYVQSASKADVEIFARRSVTYRLALTHTVAGRVPPHTPAAFGRLHYPDGRQRP